MLIRTTFFIVSIFLAEFAQATGTIEVPKGADFVRLEIQAEGSKWQRIDTPKIKRRKISLPPGEYRYMISLKSTAGYFKDTLSVAEGSHHYIHDVVSPDREKLYSWASTSPPDSPDYEIESKEAFCKSLMRKSEPPQYALDACKQLADSNNTTGLYGQGHIYEKGKGNSRPSAAKASDYYLRAYELGLQQAGVSYFMLNQGNAKGRTILYELAEQGHEWSIGVASRILSSSKNPQEREKSRSYAEQAIRNQNPDGFSALAGLAFSNDEGGAATLVESAAWFNLYMANTQGRDHAARRFTAVLEAALDPKAMQAVAEKTETLSRENVNSGLYFVLDTSIFAKLGKESSLSLSFGKGFAMPIVSFDKKYALELMPSEKFYLVTLEADGEYLSSHSFQLGMDEHQVRCLTLDHQSKELETTVNMDDKACPSTANGLTSMWKVLSQYH